MTKETLEEVKERVIKNYIDPTCKLFSDGLNTLLELRDAIHKAKSTEEVIALLEKEGRSFKKNVWDKL